MIRGGGGKSSSKQQAQSTQESGTKFNKPFLDELYSYFGADPSENPENQPAYIPASFTGANYTGANYTGANYTPVEGGDFDRLERNIYEGASSKLTKAYNDAIAKQREELAQSGALISPSQYLEGSVRSSMDRGYFDNLQAAARDAANTVLGLKASEAKRKTDFDIGQAGARTAFDVGQAGARTAFDVGEATRQTGFGLTEAERATGFNERLAQQLYKAFLNKLTLALEASKYSTGQSTSSGESKSVQGQGGVLWA